MKRTLAVVTALVACRGSSSHAPSDSGPAPTVAPASLGHKTYAFVDVTVETMLAPTPLAHQIVLVDGDSIVKIGSNVEIPADAEKIDAKGKYLIPGLHDMHVHLDGTTGMLQLFVGSGVTTVRNMAGSPRTIALREKIKAGQLLGPTIYTAGPFVDGERPRWEASDSVVNAADAQRVIADHVAQGYDFVKIYNGLTVTAYDAVAAEAKKNHLRIVGHVPFVVPLQHVLETEQASVEHLAGYAVAVERRDSPVRNQRGSAPIIKRWMYADVEKIAQIVKLTVDHHVYNTPTLVTAAAYGELYRGHLPEGASGDLEDVSPDWRARWDPKKSPKHYDSAIRRAMDEAHDKALATEGLIVKDLADAGAPIMAGTDTPNPYVIPGPSLHQELGMFVAAGLSTYAALRSATIVPAEFLGDPKDGRIEVGARADLVMLDGDPLADIHNVDKISGVMVRGRWLPKQDLKKMHDALVEKYRAPAWDNPIDLGTPKAVQYVISDNNSPVGAYAMATEGTKTTERATLEDEVASVVKDSTTHTLEVNIDRTEVSTHKTYEKADRKLIGFLTPATAMLVVAPLVSKLAIDEKQSFAIDTPNIDAPGTLEHGSLTVERLASTAGDNALEFRLRLVLDHVAQVGHLTFDEGSTVPRAFKVSSTTRPVVRSWRRR
ncbi:MAG: amidohydrolase family protein [Kofleriaceae bacterium]